MAIAFAGVHVPLLALVVYLLSGTSLANDQLVPLVAVLMVATVVGTGLTLAGLYALLAPVRSASNAIRAYLGERRVPALPTRLHDEAGRLLADVQEGITRLDTALDAASATRDRADEERRRGYQVLSSLSHELRTPLNAIIGFSEMMQQEMLGPLGSDAYRGYASDIRESGTGLLELLQGLLDMSAAEAGDVATAGGSFDPLAEMRGAIALKHLHAEGAGLTIADRLPAGLPPLRGDPRAFKQQILHLLGGLIQATQAPATLTVASAETADGLALRLATDSGRFDGDDVPELLSECWQGPQVPPRGKAGPDTVSPLGFTLCVTRALARMNGGRLRLHDVAGGGRAVELLLPLTGTADRPAPAAGA